MDPVGLEISALAGGLSGLAVVIIIIVAVVVLLHQRRRRHRPRQLQGDGEGEATDDDLQLHESKNYYRENLEPNNRLQRATRLASIMPPTRLQRTRLTSIMPPTRYSLGGSEHGVHGTGRGDSTPQSSGYSRDFGENLRPI